MAESDALLRNVTCTVLQRVAQCDAVGAGEEVLVKLQQSTRFRLILMDLHMPNMSGIDTARAVRSIAKYKHIPIIGFATSHDPSEIKACKAAGMADVIFKSLPKAELQAVVQRYMDGH